MDLEELRQLRAEWDYYDFWENEDRRDDSEDPWYWSFPTVSPSIGTNEDTGDDERRRERMAEACYEC